MLSKSVNKIIPNGGVMVIFHGTKQKKHLIKQIQDLPWQNIWRAVLKYDWLVVSTHLKNMSKWESSPGRGGN